MKKGVKKIMQKTKSIIGYAIALVLLVVAFNLSTPLSVNAIEGNVIAITESHVEFWTGAQVEIEAVLLDDFDIETIHIHYCGITPVFKCRPTVEMERTSTNTWTGIITIVDVEGTIGYYLDFRFTNGSIKFVPDYGDYLDKPNVEEVVPSFYYFIFPLVEAPPQSPASGFSDHLARNVGLIVSIPTASIGSVILGLIAYRRKR
ncbi:MAG: hypothetical protein ACTSPT_08595 [Candidatus Heimdallarchaeota archaeon]